MRKSGKCNLTHLTRSDRRIDLLAYITYRRYIFSLQHFSSYSALCIINSKKQTVFASRRALHHPSQPCTSRHHSSSSRAQLPQQSSLTAKATIPKRITSVKSALLPSPRAPRLLASRLQISKPHASPTTPLLSVCPRTRNVFAAVLSSLIGKAAYHVLPSTARDRLLSLKPSILF